MIIPTIGLSFSSPRHSSHNGRASGAGGENTATTVPMYSPLTSTMCTKPSGCPVRSLTVCHKPGRGRCLAPGRTAPDQNEDEELPQQNGPYAVGVGRSRFE